MDAYSLYLWNTDLRGFILLGKQFTLFIICWHFLVCSVFTNTQSKDRGQVLSPLFRWGSGTLAWQGHMVSNWESLRGMAISPQNLWVLHHTIWLLHIDKDGSQSVSVFSVLHQVTSVVLSAFPVGSVHSLNPEQQVLAEECSHTYDQLWSSFSIENAKRFCLSYRVPWTVSRCFNSSLSLHKSL